MSYPEPRYFGDTGEVTARIRRTDEPAEVKYANGGAVRYLATGKSTDGSFGLYRWEFGPGRSGPDPHFHKTMSESFYVLSGTVRLYQGSEWVDATAGDFMYVPPGGVHGFRNESGETASMLLLFAPGAPREEYFEVLAELGRGKRTMTDEEKAAFYIRHDNYWL